MTEPWYKTAFGEDYIDRYPHRDHEEARCLVAELLRRYSLDPCTRVFDLCCGAGRHSLAMVNAGHRVWGMDLSMALLREANARREGEYPFLARGDMRALPFADSSFDMVTHFFTAFGYFNKDEENFGVFREVARVLAPRGRYVFDFFCDEFVRGSVGTEEEHSTDGSIQRTVREVVGTEHPRIEKTVMLERVKEEPQVVSHESVRLFSPDELRHGLARSGFSIREEWGDYEGTVFDRAISKRYLAICEKVV